MSNVWVVIYLVVMIALIVSMDVLFFRDRFLERLVANAGTVLLFAAFYVVVLENR
jgi:hypothetical protein